MRNPRSILVVLILLIAAFLLPTPATAAAAATGSFVARDGTKLTLDGQPYRFTGINIYNANSNGLCSYPMDGTILDDSLAAISPSGGVIRAWFFQQFVPETNGVRDWTAFDRTLTAAHNHGFRVIATLINQWTGCGAADTRNPGDTKTKSGTPRNTSPRLIL